MTKPVSDDTLAKFAALLEHDDIRHDADQFAICEDVLFNMLKDRRIAKATSNLERLANG